MFLEIDPSPPHADELLAGLPIEAVWMWEGDALAASPPDCLGPDDPACVPRVQTPWRVWAPPANAAGVATNLRLIRGGRAYLVKARSATVWTLVGQPSPTPIRWQQGYSLAGFHVDPNAAPTFNTYLSPSPAHSGTTVFQIGSDGVASPIADLGTARIASGRSYWVKCLQDVEYDGPIRVDAASLDGVNFARTLVEHRMTIENLSEVPRSVTLSYLPSAPAPTQPAGLPTVAGDVPLRWLDYGTASVDGTLSWRELTAPTWALSPRTGTGERQTIRLGVHRTGLAPATLDFQGRGAQYQGLLTVTDGAGFRRWLPVTTQVLSPVGGASAAAAGFPLGRPGLYIGKVTVNAVSWVTAGARQWIDDDPNAPSFAPLMKCFGGVNEGYTCGADRRRCGGTPEVDRLDLVCESDADCPSFSTCVTLADCPGGSCQGFCIGGDHNGDACDSGAACSDGKTPGDGMCSTELDRVDTRPTASEFSFPILVHVSQNGVSKMLHEVTLMWQPGDTQSGTPGRHVLVTPECPPEVKAILQAGSLQDGQPFSRRISTAAFHFADSNDRGVDLPLAGDLGAALLGETLIRANSRLNPFRHRYHPDHDCDQPGECFDVTRRFTLLFESDPPPGGFVPGFGDTVFSGTYVETLEGLHRRPIQVRGPFELRQVLPIPTLNAE